MVLAWNRVRRVDAYQIVVLCVLLLTGCRKTEYVPYTYVREGVYAYEDAVEDNGVRRARTVADKQALQYITSEDEISLVPGELAYYEGTLYSLSNYRALLLDLGYEIESETRTADILDTVLSGADGRIRLIYQASGTIRIMFEKTGCLGHIQLEGGSNEQG